MLNPAPELVVANFLPVGSQVRLTFDQDLLTGPVYWADFTFRKNNQIRQWSVEPSHVGSVIEGPTTFLGAQVGADQAIYEGFPTGLTGLAGAPVEDFVAPLITLPP